MEWNKKKINIIWDITFKEGGEISFINDTITLPLKIDIFLLLIK